MRPTALKEQLPPPHPDANALSQRLLARIQVELSANRGWLSFDHFQALCLYEPGLGYYSGPTFKFGSSGDFTTAPEMSPLFGRTLALEIQRVLGSLPGESQTRSDVIELGAGSGKLAVDILRELDLRGALPSRYLILELSADLAARQKQAILAAHPHLISRVKWLSEMPNEIVGCVIANEVLDAVPVRLIHINDGQFLERGVALGADGELTFADRGQSDGDFIAIAKQRLAHVNNAGSYITEISQAAEALVSTVAERLKHGAAIWIDYGFSAREFYHPQRNTGTLMCHYRHFAHPDPFFYPGLQDITTHVDFTAIAAAAEQGGAEVCGYTTQANFLLNAGLTRLLDAQISSGELTPGTPAYMSAVSTMQRLVSPSEMGELFKVIAFTKGLQNHPMNGFSGMRNLAL